MVKQLKAFKKKKGRLATNDASVMWSNGGVGCWVGSGSGSDDVDIMVAEGSKGLMKQYG